jgi:ArsR family transcriptional regulator
MPRETESLASASPAGRISLATRLKALADPRRLSIFEMLMEGVQCNCEIAERLDLSLSLISYHLRILTEAGLVQGERDPHDARWLYYTINGQALVELKQEMAHLLDAKRIQPRQPSCGPNKCSESQHCSGCEVDRP